MPDTHILDLSHWNTVTSFYDIRKRGVIGIIHKSTEGTSYVDPDYAPRMADALDCDLLWGAYHFLKPGQIEAQMRHFLKHANLPPGSRACLDHEDPKATLADIQSAVAILHELDETLQIAVYSGHLIKEQLGTKHDPVLAKTALWLAQYTSGQPSWPTGTWKHYSLWQWTDQGSCPGVTGNVDCNEFNGSVQNCALWMSPTIAPVSRPMSPGTPTVEITVAPGTIVIVNGVETIAV